MAKLHYRKMFYRPQGSRIEVFQTQCGMMQTHSTMKIEMTTDIPEVTCMNCLRSLKSEHSRKALEVYRRIRDETKDSFFDGHPRNISLNRKMMLAINEAIVDAEISMRAGKYRFDKITRAYRLAFFYGDPEDVQKALEKLCKKMNIKYKGDDES